MTARGHPFRARILAVQAAGEEPHTTFDRRRGRTALSLLLANTALCTVPVAHAQSASPQGGQVVAGAATITAGGTAVTVNQSSQRAVVNWDSFSVGQNNAVNFVQPNADAAILNRVTSSTTSQIAGAINANGQVYLVNPNGIAITATGTVNVGSGFVASTLNISDDDFQSGKLAFVGSGASANVSNHGSISVGSGGFAALLGGTVANTGIISVPLGKIGMGSGETATLDLTGDGFLQIAAPTSASGDRALVSAGGVVSGARVELRAATVANAIRDAVNVPGALLVRGAYQDGGAVVLDGYGGSTSISGMIDASSGVGKGGIVTIESDRISLTDGASILATGATGGGSVFVGGGVQGGGGLAQATKVTMAGNALIDVSATNNGAGGTAVLWSDVTNVASRTVVAGTIRARGAGIGDGGFIETSGYEIDSTGASINGGSDFGKGGLWLIDPADSVITQLVANGYASTLNSGTDVMNSVTGSITWNPGVTLVKSAGGNATLTLRTSGAGGTGTSPITLNNARITSTSGALNIVAWSRYDSTTSLGQISTVTGANFSTNGGNVWIGGGGDVSTIDTWHGLTVGANSATTVALNGLTLSTAGGHIMINGSTSATNPGVTLNGATINTGGGDLTVRGSALGSLTPYAIRLSGSNAISVGSGSALIAGTSTVNAFAVALNGPLSLTSSGAGSVTIQGIGNGGGVVQTSTITASGTTSIIGSAPNYAAFWAQSGGNITNTSGDFTITASGNDNTLSIGPVAITNAGSGTLSLVANAGPTAFSGVYFRDGNSSLINSGGGAIRVVGGIANTYAAISVASGATVTTNGDMMWQDIATSTGADALKIAGSVTVQSGNLSIVPQSGKNVTVMPSGVLGTSGTGALTVSMAGGSFKSSGALTLGSSRPTSISAVGAGAISSGAVTYSNAAANTLTLNAASTVTLGSITSTGGLLETTVSGWAITGSGDINTKGGLLTINNSADSSLSGVISGNGGVNKVGAGNITLTKANTFTGDLTISSGQVSMGNVDSLGAVGNRVSIAAGAALNISNTSGAYADYSHTWTGSGAINYTSTAGAPNYLAGNGVGFSGTIATSGSGVAGFNNIDFSGASVTANAGATILAAGSTNAFGSLAGNGSIRPGGASSGPTTLYVGALGSSSAFSGALGDVSAATPLNLVKVGGGTLTLSGVNTYRGSTTVRAGTVQIGGSGRLGSGSYAGAIAIDAAGALQYSSSVNQTLSGVISGPGAIIKDATSAILTLSGGNTYTGATVVNAGTVNLSGSWNVGSGSTATTVVGSGGSLSGSGVITAGTLATSGGGTINLTGPNLVGALASSGTIGAITFNNAQALAVGSIASIGAVNLRALSPDADLTIQSGSAVSSSVGGDSVVLVAGRNFNNQSGVGAVNAPNGRWLIYSATPAGDAFNGLDSGATAIWGTTHGLTITHSGNRYVFADRPVLTVSSVNATKTYGVDATSTVADSYQISGYHSGVANAFLGDSFNTALSGTVSAISTGAASSANAGQYAIALTGALSTTSGYTLAYQASGVLSVNPAPLTITANDTVKHYDGIGYSGGAGVGYIGLVNGDTAMSLGGTLLYGGTSQGAINAGDYTISASGLASGNYTISYQPGALRIDPLPVPPNSANLPALLDHVFIQNATMYDRGGLGIEATSCHLTNEEEAYELDGYSRYGIAVNHSVTLMPIDRASCSSFRLLKNATR